MNIVRFNEWWETGRVPADLYKAFKRPVLAEILKDIGKRQIITLVGLRRVGKTSILYQVIDDLLRSGMEPKTVFYFSFDEDAENLEAVLEKYREEILRRQWRESKLYIFLDEIQKAKNCENILKKYYDLYPNIKFVICGSSSLAVEKKTKESLAGRVLDFYIQPFSFREFLELKNKGIAEPQRDIFNINFGEMENLWKDFIPVSGTLRAEFSNFLLTGGFPEIADEMDEKEIKKYIKNSVVDKILHYDIPQEFKIEEPELLVKILKMIANNPGLTVDYQQIASDFNRDRKTVSKYIFYLKASFLVHLLYNFSINFMTSEKKLKKAYLSNTGLIFSLLEFENSDQLLAKAVENLASVSLDAKFFYKQYKEIDIVLVKGGKIMPIEVKYQSQITKSDIKPLLTFMDKFRTNKALCITKDVFKKELTISDNSGNKEVFFIPAWFFALMLQRRS